MRIAYFSPLNPSPSGISDYSEELLPALAAHADLDLIVDGYTPSNSAITSRFRVIDDRAYDPRAYDLALYQLGNSPPNAYTYRRALAEPGVVVLHELVLHHLVAWLTLNHGDRAGYIDAMRDAYGETGAQLAQREALGLEALNRFDYPLSERIIKTARGFIAHSRYVADAVQRIAPHIPVALIPHELPPISLLPRDDARAQLGLPRDALLVGSFGNLGPVKRATVLLDAFRQARAEFPGRPRLVLVGGISPNYDLDGLLDLFELRDAVQVVGYVPFESFNTYMAAMDVCVNLRYPTAGETSGAVLRMMAHAKPVVVSRIGWFAELPDDAVAKIDPDESELPLLRATLSALLRDPALRAALGANARAYVLAECDLENAARSYAEFMQAVIEGRAVSNVKREASNGIQEASSKKQVAGSIKQESGDEKSAITETQGDEVNVSPVDLRAEVGLAYVELGLDVNDPVLREAAQAIVELGLNEDTA